MEEKENERASGVDDGGVWYSTLSTRPKKKKKTKAKKLLLSIKKLFDSVKRRRILERLQSFNCSLINWQTGVKHLKCPLNNVGLVCGLLNDSFQC